MIISPMMLVSQIINRMSKMYKNELYGGHVFIRIISYSLVKLLILNSPYFRI